MQNASSAGRVLHPVLGNLFQCDPDIRLCGTEIYLDPGEPREVGVISHGHSDHIGRHRSFLSTAPTAAFLRIRAGADLRGTELAFRQIHCIGEFDVELFPAGHVLGSAMVRVGRRGESLLYTGDFRLRPSLTAEPAEVPQADAVIMESTYGSPEWAFPTRDELGDRLAVLVHEILGRGKTPVLLAYSLGKAQETCAMLKDEGLEIVLHPSVAQIADVYAKHGVDLGRYEVWTPQQSLAGRTTTRLEGKVLIIPPHMRRDIRRIRNRETVALTGWALRWKQPGVDHALPLSDHADFEELLELVERCRARVVYVTHGSAKFAAELRSRGVRAEFLRRRPQMRLF